MNDRSVAVDDGEQSTNKKLPRPIVIYPSHYGTFIGFKKRDEDEIHFCSCARDAATNYVQAKYNDLQESHREPTIENVLNSGFPGEIKEYVLSKGITDVSEIVDVLNFEAELCHMCNVVVPQKRYCHEMYGTVFGQNYGWYVNQKKLEYGLSSETRSSISLSVELLDSIPKDVIDAVDVDSKTVIKTQILQFEELYSKRRNRRSTMRKAERDEEKTVRKAKQSGEITKEESWERRSVINAKYDYDRVLNHHDREKFERLNEALSEIQNRMSEAAENEVRRAVGHYEKGNRWTNETILYQLIESEYGDEYTIKRHHRPKWLEGLELDVYLVEPAVGIEYQGVQHYEAVEHWGGEEALEKRQNRDQRTRDLCEEHGVKLVEIRYDEELSEELVKSYIDPLVG